MRFSLTLLMIVLLLGLACFRSCHGHGGFKGMFVFGTSLVDNGNNNYLAGSGAKVNYLPYGVDFPLGPTGRYFNAETIADILGRRLGLPLIPAFLDPTTKGERIIRGVNYGAGSSGILESTGVALFGRVISMNQQIDEFENTTLPELRTLLRSGGEEILPGYLFMVATGNNDVANYLFGAGNVTVEAYIGVLMSTFSNQLKRLYGLGARNFVLTSVYPIGCNPWMVEFANSGGCVAAVNRASEEFYTQLVPLVDKLTAALPGSQFLVVNTYKIVADIINDPLPRGFSNARDSCCERKLTRVFKILCKEGGGVCGDRNSYVFFDGQHNTQAVNAIIANKAFTSLNKSEVYPMNVQQLAALRSWTL